MQLVFKKHSNTRPGLGKCLQLLIHPETPTPGILSQRNNKRVCRQHFGHEEIHPSVICNRKKKNSEDSKPLTSGKSLYNTVAVTRLYNSLEAPPKSRIFKCGLWGKNVSNTRKIVHSNIENTYLNIKTFENKK